MKRFLVFLSIMLISFSTLSAETLTHSTLKYEYEDYSEDEFPIWTNEIRRAETLFFGSYVFTIPIAGLCMTGLKSINVIKSTSTEADALITIGVASGLSLFVATLDWIIGRVQN